MDLLLHLMGNFVRIFKYVTLCCYLTLLVGQTPKNVQFTHLDSIVIHDSLRVLLQDDNSAQYEYQLISFDYEDSVNVNYELSPIDRMIKNIHFNQGIGINPKILSQMFSHIILSETEINNSLKYIKNSYSFIVDTPVYTWGIQDEKEGVIINFVPSFKHQFSALIGANRNENNMWEATGEINLNVENIFKNAESINLYWKRLDTLSQEIQFQFKQPHTLGTPFGLNISLERNTHDGYFTESLSQINLSTHLKYMGLLSFGYENSNIYATEEGIDVGFSSHGVKSIISEVVSISLNNRWLPTRGFSYTFTGKVGKIKEDLMYSLIMKGARIYPIQNNWLGHIGVWIEQVKSRNNNVPQSRYIRFGGMKTMKGFRENEFQTTLVISPEIQFSYILNDEMHFSSFYQTGWYESDQPILQSVGFGLKQVKDKSIIEILYGTPIDAPITNGYLHFRFISRL